jgi:CRP-like cAMP-binding protein
MDDAARLAPAQASNCRIADNPAMTPDVRALFDRNFPELAWTDAAWARAESWLRVRRLAAGTTLIAPGQPTQALYGVLSGSVETRLSTADGHVSVVAQVEPGWLFGLASFASGRPSSYEAVTVGATRLVAIGPQAYARLMDEVPGFARSLMREFARRFDDTMHLLEAARHRGAEERLCIALQHLRREGRAGDGGPGGGPWTLRVTQAELAARANVSRQTANEWLAHWAARGWVERRYRGLAVTRWPTARGA